MNIGIYLHWREYESIDHTFNEGLSYEPVVDPKMLMK